ncbi:hypothetical protein [uncultured Chitinophaga sp.]|uniref:hypothetical protein n=1 Tax=uncultured Chitinophaga sp. TaxID=339340 RepID=UPI0025FB4EAE|nr:hypothetical protein [uncultured Chitinophaga sp.]
MMDEGFRASPPDMEASPMCFQVSPAGLQWPPLDIQASPGGSRESPVTVQKNLLSRYSNLVNTF